MIKLIGTTHLMSKEEIIKIIELEHPDIIGVELCQTRLNLLVLNQPVQEQEDNSILGKISKSVKDKAKENNTQYGCDMITASNYALENKLILELLDRDISEVRDLMNKIPKNELEGFMRELAEFEKLSILESTKQVKEEDVVNELKTNYPVSYEFLIKSREMYIINKILKLIIKYPNKKIICFLGKGHINNISKEVYL